MAFQNKTYHFVVDGVPLKRRIRGRGGVYYTPRETEQDEARVRDAFRDHYSVDPRSQKTFSVEIMIYTARNLDGDNVEKAVLDALNHVLWENDRQVKQMFWVFKPIGRDATEGECIWVKALEL
jgi:Holliday junction resolvase RusA-like endonuclease